MKQKTMYAVLVTSDDEEFVAADVYPTLPEAKRALFESLKKVKQIIADRGFEYFQEFLSEGNYKVCYDFYTAASYSCYYYGEIKKATVYENA